MGVEHNDMALFEVIHQRMEIRQIKTAACIVSALCTGIRWAEFKVA